MRRTCVSLVESVAQSGGGSTRADDVVDRRVRRQILVVAAFRPTIERSGTLGPTSEVASYS